MNRFLFIPLCLVFLADSVFGSLPAPVNVYMDSIDFHHVLRWDPGPGTPTGTLYTVFQRERRKGKHFKNVSSTTETSVTLTLDPYRDYKLKVKAFYNQTESPESRPEVSFMACKQTKLSPPTLSLAGCGNCIQINISLNNDVMDFYNPHFRIWWWKRNESKNYSISSEDSTYTLNNLEKGAEYCVQVEYILYTLNPHGSISAESCTFTSIVEPRGVGVFLGAVSVIMIIIICVIASAILFLHYTGIMCKLKERLPQALTASPLISGKFLTLETTIPVLISVSSRASDAQNNKTCIVTLPVPKASSTGEEIEEEEDDEEEEEGHGEKDAYMTRAPGLSSSESSCNVLMSSAGTTETVMTETTETEPQMEVKVEFNPYERTDRAVNLPLVSEEGQTVVQGHATGQEEEEEEKEELCHSSGNINLFSVTLSALAVDEEEEEEEGGDLLKLCNLEPLLPTHSLSHDASWAHTTCLRDSDDDEEEEEEEECSGYMGRM